MPGRTNREEIDYRTAGAPGVSRHLRRSLHERDVLVPVDVFHLVPEGDQQNRARDESVFIRPRSPEPHRCV